jgi:hypothetical protein
MNKFSKWRHMYKKMCKVYLKKNEGSKRLTNKWTYLYLWRRSIIFGVARQWLYRVIDGDDLQCFNWSGSLKCLIKSPFHSKFDLFNIIVIVPLISSIRIGQLWNKYRGNCDCEGERHRYKGWERMHYLACHPLSNDYWHRHSVARPRPFHLMKNQCCFVIAFNRYWDSHKLTNCPKYKLGVIGNKKQSIQIISQLMVKAPKYQLKQRCLSM